MDVRENWTQLNQRIKNENEALVPGLFQIHTGAFEDLRKNGHTITANGEPANILAAKLDPDDRFSLACTIGRGLVNARTGMVDGGFAEICEIQQAEFFPNCIAIALGAILENIHPGPPGMKMTVLCLYERIKGQDDPLRKTLSALAPCFPWAVFQLKVTEKDPPQAAAAPVIQLDQMNTLFHADGAVKVDTGRTSFSGQVVRGELREGDVLNVTDGRGRQICPPGVVRAIFLKDRVENGKPVGEQCPVLARGQHADSVLVTVEIPKGTYNGIVLSKKEGAKQTEMPAPAAPKAAPAAPAAEEAHPADNAKQGFFSRLFGKRKP